MKDFICILRMYGLFILLCVLVLFPNNVKAASDVVFAGTESLGVFKSTDGGLTWAAFSNGLTNFQVFSLAIDPVDPDTVYLGGINGVFKSTDAGQTWVSASNGIVLGGLSAITNIVIDPTNPDVIYAAHGLFEGNGMFKSTDGAASWNQVNTGLTTSFAYDVRSVVIDPVQTEKLYLTGVTGLGNFRTADGAANWEPWPLFGGGFTLAIDPVHPATLYASGPFANSFNFLKTTDSGATWNPSNNGITDVFCHVIRIDPTDHNTLYAGTDNGVNEVGTFVSKSIDGGANWVAASTGLSAVKNLLTLSIDAMDTSTIYAGTAVGVYKTSNGGESWSAANVGLPLTRIRAIAIAPLPFLSQLQTVAGLVQALAESGSSINAGQSNALISKLEGVLDKLNRGNAKSACNQLGSFLNQVNGHVASGNLTPEEASPLIDLTASIRDLVPCS